MSKDNLQQIKDERELVRILKDLFEESKPSGFKKIFRHTGLSTKRFRDLWSEWWGGDVPPRLEVDLIFVFEDIKNSDRVLLAGVEVELFRDKAKSFCDGLQQILSFGLFGFDSLVLWHIFSEEMDNRKIEDYVRSTKEIIDGFALPVVYFATKLIGRDRFEFFAPWSFYSSGSWNASYLLSCLKSCCEGKRNPLLHKQDIEKRRKTLKILLKIPV